MGRGNGETELGAGQDGDRGTHLGRETTGGGHVGHLVTEGAHDVVTVGHQTKIDGNTSKGKNPDGDGGLLDVNVSVLPDVKDGGKGTDGIGNIVGTVGKGGEAGSDDLDGREETLSIAVVLGSVVVDSVGVLVMGDVDLLGKTVGEGTLELLAKGLLLGLESNQRSIGLAFTSLKISISGLATLLLENRGDLALGLDEGDDEEVEPPEVLVVLDSAAEEGAEEEEAPEEDKGTDTESNTDGNTNVAVRLEGGIWGTLEDDVEDVDGQSNTEVGGDGNETALERVLVSQDQELSGTKDEGTDNTGADGGDDPGEDNLGDATPLNTVGTEGRDTSTANGTDNGVGGRDWPAAGGGEQDPGGGTDQSANHGQLLTIKRG